MKKSNAVALALACTLAAQLPAAQGDCLGMVLHAHRGTPDAPENSALAVRRAFDGGWDGAEIDIQRLADQAWVVHHDPLAGRTTSLRGRRIAELDSRSWKEVRLRDRKGAVGSEPAPFLTDVLDQIGNNPDKVLNVEIKEVARNCSSASDAVQLLAHGRPDGHWFLTSIDRAQLQCVRRADPHGYVGQIVLDPKALAAQSRYASLGSRLKAPVLDGAWLAGLRRDVGAPVGVHVDAATLEANPGLLADAKAAGVAVFTYSLSSDQAHAAILRSTARRSGLLPSGAIIDGAPDKFCAALGPLAAVQP